MIDTHIPSKPFNRVALDLDGNAGWRTALMPRSRAEAFARCLRTRESVKAARIQMAAAAHPPRNWFVFVIPAKTRQAEVKEWLQDERDFRAATEGEFFQFFSDSALRGGAVWCISTTGEVYETSETRCTCPDYGVRCRRAGLVCKHARALALRGRSAVISEENTSGEI